MLIKDLYKNGSPVISFEVFPPKADADIETIYAATEQLAALRPDFISVTYGALGRGGASKTAELAAEIEGRYGIPALSHLTGVGASRADIRGALRDLRERGVANILALRGDLPDGADAGGDYPYAAALIEEIAADGGFCVGAACYPEGHIDCPDLALDIRHLRRKQDAGAQFLISQLFFDNDYFLKFRDRARKGGVTLPISAGVMPILGRSQIERMIFMCGASLPSEIVKLLHRYEKSPDDLSRAGIEYAARQIEGLLSAGVDGVHIYTMNRPAIARACMRHIGRLT